MEQPARRFCNGYNAPDDFENAALKKMEAPDYPHAKVIRGEGDSSFRMMKPVYIKQACLPCHGGPMGSIDAAGWVRKGYKLGELRGAISIWIFRS